MTIAQRQPVPTEVVARTKTFAVVSTKTETINGREFAIPLDARGYVSWKAIGNDSLLEYASAYCEEHGLGKPNDLKKSYNVLYQMLNARGMVTDLFPPKAVAETPEQRIRQVLSNWLDAERVDEIVEMMKNKRYASQTKAERLEQMEMQLAPIMRDICRFGIVSWIAYDQETFAAKMDEYSALISQAKDAAAEIGNASGRDFPENMNLLQMERLTAIIGAAEQRFGKKGRKLVVRFAKDNGIEPLIEKRPSETLERLEYAEKSLKAARSEKEERRILIQNIAERLGARLTEEQIAKVVEREVGRLHRITPENVLKRLEDVVAKGLLDLLPGRFTQLFANAGQYQKSLIAMETEAKRQSRIKSIMYTLDAQFHTDVGDRLRPKLERCSNPSRVKERALDLIEKVGRQRAERYLLRGCQPLLWPDKTYNEWLDARVTEMEDENRTEETLRRIFRRDSVRVESMRTLSCTTILRRHKIMISELGEKETARYLSEAPSVLVNHNWNDFRSAVSARKKLIATEEQETMARERISCIVPPEFLSEMERLKAARKVTYARLLERVEILVQAGGGSAQSLFFDPVRFQAYVRNRIYKTGRNRAVSVLFTPEKDDHEEQVIPGGASFEAALGQQRRVEGGNNALKTMNNLTRYISKVCGEEEAKRKIQAAIKYRALFVVAKRCGEMLEERGPQFLDFAITDGWASICLSPDEEWNSDKNMIYTQFCRKKRCKTTKGLLEEGYVYGIPMEAGSMESVHVKLDAQSAYPRIMLSIEGEYRADIMGMEAEKVYQTILAVTTGSQSMLRRAVRTLVSDMREFDKAYEKMYAGHFSDLHVRTYLLKGYLLDTASEESILLLDEMDDAKCDLQLRDFMLMNFKLLRNPDAMSLLKDMLVSIPEPEDWAGGGDSEEDHLPDMKMGRNISGKKPGPKSADKEEREKRRRAWNAGI